MRKYNNLNLNKIPENKMDIEESKYHIIRESKLIIIKCYNQNILMKD